jgi:hypothetical protein
VVWKIKASKKNRFGVEQGRPDEFAENRPKFILLKMSLLKIAQNRFC